MGSKSYLYDIVGVVVAIFDVAVEYQSGRANVKTTVLNILKGFFACSLIEKLILDFRGVEYISSAGLRVVLNAQKKMQQIGGIKVINVGEEVMEVFEMTGFVDILVIE